MYRLHAPLVEIMAEDIFDDDFGYAAFGRWVALHLVRSRSILSGLRVLAPVSFQATLQAVYTDGADLFWSV